MIRHRVREEAAIICAVAASGGVLVFSYRFYAYRPIQMELGFHFTSRDLAIEAYSHVRKILREGDPESTWTREVDAEAEALLRCGWAPESR